jgi:hypothetical protein
VIIALSVDVGSIPLFSHFVGKLKRILLEDNKALDQLRNNI